MKHCRRISVAKAQTEPEPDPDEQEQQDFLELLIFRIGVALVAGLKAFT